MEKRQYNIGIIVGSLRKASYCLKMAQFIRQARPQNLRYSLISIEELPIYNEDLETESAPVAWLDFRNAIRHQDGILFITPEYNRSVPAVLKNAIDIGSAPHGKNVFESKPAAIISLSPGKMGAFGANHHLRQSLVFLNMPVMQQPEAYIGNSAEIFGQGCAIQVESIRHFITQFLEAFSAWVVRQKKELN
ncbi:NADPH-dependent FMN reductase [Pedobacter vanadiisoli]|uniref:NADPH-dependent FMN reductase n=1 Tax=Pedobacter vanadiisoli TaxID=1761975 RepID=A0ABW5MIS0_9SPHI